MTTASKIDRCLAAIDSAVDEIVEQFDEWGLDARELTSSFDGIKADVATAQAQMIEMSDQVIGLENRIKELQAEKAKLASDASWAADYHRQQLDARPELGWK